MFNSGLVFLEFGCSVTDEVRDALAQTAYLMLKGRQKRKKIRSKHCEGLVRTNLQFTSFVGFSQMIAFQAEVEVEHGKQNIRFLFNTSAVPLMEREEKVRVTPPNGPMYFRPNAIKEVAHGNN